MKKVFIFTCPLCGEWLALYFFRTGRVHCACSGYIAFELVPQWLKVLPTMREADSWYAARFSDN